MNVRKVSLFVVCLFAIATALGFILLGLMIWALENPKRDTERPPTSWRPSHDE